ncbi:hypothetical protein DCAR_0313414 [Daucus carota subsp. sativus]|uniref:DUF4220 domain-containing protein n=1 Tax=Daucus carota subsp. sativus TaxID=79200 RepID=A0A166C0F7_DAUCS|nr:PREDICTED: uncharacterized protein LOC108212719 [Daucus carota subsp. sativus]WOG94121.1 hypothetical protein DCAR_0313414 [Daucus carota subsp. sativus]
MISGKLDAVLNKFEIRGMVLLSLFLQIVLIALGNRRKYSTRNWIRVVLWLAYLSADWVATVALGVLSNGDSATNLKDDSMDEHYVIIAFWAPFLLVHLGGPDTITAYSLEDNELWLRHLLGLFVQVFVAFYVFIRALKPNPLNFVALPIFVAGIIKYGERTWILRSASSKHFRESLLPNPDPGPNYSKFIEEYVLKEKEGFELSWSVSEAPKPVAHKYATGKNDIIPNASILNAAYEFFLTFKRLFADLILSFQDLEKSLSFFQESSWDNAFKVIEVELGFMYDVLYTKASIIHSIWGVALRATSFLSTAFGLIVFCLIDWKSYKAVDLCISLVLLVGAIGLEVYAVLLLLSSDWTLLLLSKLKNPLIDFIYKFITCFNWITSKKKWSNSMAQYNLLSSSLNNKATIWNFIKNHVFQILDDYQDVNSVDIPTEINISIFSQLVEKSKGASDFRMCKKLCGARGEYVLAKYKCAEKFTWSVEFEFDHSILLWHLATDLCYFTDKTENPDSVLDSNCRISKLLSDYMLYLLVKRPFMLPNGIGQIRFQDTCAEATEFFQELKITPDEDEACTKLLQVEIIIPPHEVKGDRSKSVLFDACKLAKLLQSLECGELWEKQQKWEMMSHMWIEMLSYAACHCTWKDHAQQIRRGGELITHVWLLMAHLGLTEQFQITHGHARTKLVVQ